MEEFKPYDCELTGRSIVEAGAGTGKTYNIQILFMRLLLEKKIPIQNILVVTFTKFATEELLGRLHAILMKMLEAFNLHDRGQHARLEEDEFKQVHPIYRKVYAAVSKAERTESRQRLNRALEDFDQAAIMTIHGFCQRMLSCHAFDSKERFELALLEDTEDLQLEIATDFYRKLKYGENQASTTTFTINDVLHSMNLLPEQLLHYLHDVIHNDDDGIDGKLATKIYWTQDGSQPTIAAFQTDLDAILADLRQDNFWNGSPLALMTEANLINDGRAYLKKHGYDSFQAVNEAMRQGFKEPKPLAAWKLFLSLQDSGHLAAMVKAAPRRVLLAKTYSVFHQTLKKVNELVGRFQVLYGMQFMDFYHERMQYYKTRDGFLTYDDMINRLGKMVLDQEGGKQLREAIRSQFPYIFVDEFQDTDPVQFGIFSSLVSQTDANRGLFMIGDPKQAIYSFRGGDVYSYLDAKNQVPEEQRYTLNVNYRSGKRYLKALQQFYDLKQQNGISLFGVDGIELAPIVPCEQNDRCLLKGNEPYSEPIEFLYLESVKNGASYTEEDIYDATIDKVKELIGGQRNIIRDAMRDEDNIFAGVMDDDNNHHDNNHPAEEPWLPNYSIGNGETRKAVTADDIAILVPTKRQGLAIEKKLHENQIDTVWMSDSDIYKQPEAEAMLELLQLLCSDIRSQQVLVVLNNSLFRCTPEELRLLSEDTTQAQEYFAELKRLWEQHGFYRMFRTLLEVPNSEGRQWLCNLPDLEPGRFAPDGTLAEHLIYLDVVKGRYFLGRFRQLGELLHQVETRRHLSPGRLLAYLQAKMQDDNSDDEDIAVNVQRCTDAPAVKIMTLHASKGLEFPIVIIPDFVTHDNTKACHRLFHEQTDDGHRRCLDMYEWMTGKPEVLLEGAFGKQSLEEHNLERLRLLYVGLTRAKYYCYLPFFTSTMRYPQKTWLLNTYLCHDNIPRKKTPEDIPAGRQPSPAPESEARTFDGYIVCDWMAGSFSTFSKGFKHKENGSKQNNKGQTSGTDEPSDQEVPVLAETATELPSATLPGDDSQSAIFKFSGGTDAGTVWHELFETMDFTVEALHRPEVPADAEEVIKAALGNKMGLYAYLRAHKNDEETMKAMDAAFVRMLQGILSNPLGDFSNPAGARFCLKDIDAAHRVSELPFLYVLKNGSDCVLLKEIKALLERHGIKTRHWAENAEGKYLDWAITGFLDLLCQAPDGKYYIIDWKTNRRQAALGDFEGRGVAEEIEDNFYALQYLIYTVALWHILKEKQGIELTEDTYERLFGGVLYLFVRGIAAPLPNMTAAETARCCQRGIFFDRPSFDLVKDLKELLDCRAKIVQEGN